MHVASNTSQQMKSARDLLFLHMRKMYCAYNPQCNTPKLQAIFLKAYCVAVAQSTTFPFSSVEILWGKKEDSI